MSLVALDGTPLVAVGQVGVDGTIFLGGSNATLLDAANEACIMVGQVFTDDGGSHTIDTTGSSSLGWLTGSLTFANAGTTVKVGLAAVDTATGPPARAANVADVITFDVSKSLTGGGGGITANAWQTHVPDAGTKTIAHGDIVAFAVQMTARGGADAVRPTMGSVALGGSTLPTVTGFTGAAYSLSSSYPNVVITFSDGTLGFLYGSNVFTTQNTTQTWNNTGTNEYGNFFQMPVPVKIYGLTLNCAVSGDADFVLYSDPLGTPVAQKTCSVDLNTVGSATANKNFVVLFSSPYSTTASQPLAGIIKPTSATNVSSIYLTVNSSSHQKAYSLGTNCYAVNRASGAFAAQNSSKDRFAIGLLVGAFDLGGGGISRARAAAGF